MILHSFFVMIFCSNVLCFFKTAEENEDAWENPHNSFVKSNSYVKDSEFDGIEIATKTEFDGTEIAIKTEDRSDSATYDQSPLKRAYADPNLRSGRDAYDQSPLKRAYTDPNLRSGRDACPTFLSRFINIILENTGLKNYYMKPGENIKTITIDISVTKKTLKTLQKFNSGENVNYHDLDESFLTFFEVFEKIGKKSKPDPDDDFDDGISYTKTFFETFSSMEHNQIIILATSIILGIILFLILRNGIRFDSTIAIFFILYYLLRIIQSLWAQYEDIYAQRIISLERSLDKGGSFKIPDECFPSKTALFNRFYYKLFPSDDPCKRYLQSKKSIFSELDIELAITQPIYGLLFSALPAIGDSTGKATSSFVGYFSTPVQLVLIPLIVYCFFSSIFSSGITGIIALFRFRHFSNPPLNSGTSPQVLPPPQSPQLISPPVINNFHFSQPAANFPNLSLPGTTNNACQQISSINGFSNQDTDYNYGYVNKLHALKRNRLRKRRVMKPLSK